jgi:hypothetical protein
MLAGYAQQAVRCLDSVAVDARAVTAPRGRPHVEQVGDVPKESDIRRCTPAALSARTATERGPLGRLNTLVATCTNLKGIQVGPDFSWRKPPNHQSLWMQTGALPKVLRHGVVDAHFRAIAGDAVDEFLARDAPANIAVRVPWGGSLPIPASWR